MFRICVLTIYFGKFPSYFNLWLESCRRNPSIDFLIITDQDLSGLPPNVECRKSTLRELQARFSESIGMPVKLDKPYKLCDLKPMYGVTFQPELKGYDFWGHCDVDLIWGDIMKFLPDDVLTRYDKIFSLGHLSLYRNVPRVNGAFRLKGSLRGDYTQVVTTDKSCVFDEIYGIKKIFEANNLPVYDRELAADIGFRNRRMKIAGLQNKNYPYQLFMYKDGKVLRAYEEDGRILQDEFAYIHLQKRHYDATTDADSFIVGQTRFVDMPEEITLSVIKCYNPYPGRIYEKVEYFVKDYRFRIGRRIKQFFMK